jgi:hypothetical protein
MSEPALFDSRLNPMSFRTDIGLSEKPLRGGGRNTEERQKEMRPKRE